MASNTVDTLSEWKLFEKLQQMYWISIDAPIKTISYNDKEMYDEFMAWLEYKESSKNSEETTNVEIQYKGTNQQCKHGTRKTRCKECGGGSLCKHNRQRYSCTLCGSAMTCKANKQTMCTTFGNKKYDGYCLRCYIHLFPDKPVTRNYKIKEKYVTDSIQEFLKEYNNSLEFSLDKSIGGCSAKRPDMFIELYTHVIVVEIDENQHKSKDYTSCDTAREVVLLNDVAERPCVFLRFNPDSYNDSDGKHHKSCFKFNKSGICVLHDKVEFDERIRQLFSRIIYHTENVPPKLITKEFLFYDKS